jgi:membrane protein implicated in regulation of membrane protease activity
MISMLKKIGIAILMISLLFLIGSGLYHLMIALINDPGLPLLIRFALGGLIFALIIILIALIKERWEDKKNERFDHREH